MPSMNRMKAIVRFRTGHRGLSGEIIISPEGSAPPRDALILVGRAYNGPAPTTQGYYEASLAWDGKLTARGQMMVWAETLRPVVVENCLETVQVPGGFSHKIIAHKIKGWNARGIQLVATSAAVDGDMATESWRSKVACDKAIEALKKGLEEQAASIPLPAFGGDPIVTTLSLPVGEFTVSYVMHPTGKVQAKAQNKVGGAPFLTILKVGIPGVAGQNFDSSDESWTEQSWASPTYTMQVSSLKDVVSVLGMPIRAEGFGRQAKLTWDCGLSGLVSEFEARRVLSGRLENINAYYEGVKGAWACSLPGELKIANIPLGRSGRINERSYLPPDLEYGVRDMATPEEIETIVSLLRDSWNSDEEGDKLIQAVLRLSRFEEDQAFLRRLVDAEVLEAQDRRESQSYSYLSDDERGTRSYTNEWKMYSFVSTRYGAPWSVELRDEKYAALDGAARAMACIDLIVERVEKAFAEIESAAEVKSEIVSGHLGIGRLADIRASFAADVEAARQRVAAIASGDVSRQAKAAREAQIREEMRQAAEESKVREERLAQIAAEQAAARAESKARQEAEIAATMAKCVAVNASPMGGKRYTTSDFEFDGCILYHTKPREWGGDRSNVMMILPDEGRSDWRVTWRNLRDGVEFCRSVATSAGVENIYPKDPEEEYQAPMPSVSKEPKKAQAPAAGGLKFNPFAALAAKKG